MGRPWPSQLEVIVLDTSAVLALLDRHERAHEEVVAAFETDPGPYLVPTAILAEIGYLIEHRLGSTPLRAFLDDLQAGAFSLDCGDGDIVRIAELVERYADLPLGFSDAAVIACAERHRGRVLTLDRRDFEVVGRQVHLTLLP